MTQPKLKMVRAIRAGTWDGHRRRIGAIFPVEATANEKWFVTVSEVVPEGTELPTQIMNAQAPAGKSFIDVMRQLGDAPPADTSLPSTPITLAEAAATLPKAPSPVIAQDDDLV